MKIFGIMCAAGTGIQDEYLPVPAEWGGYVNFQAAAGNSKQSKPEASSSRKCLCRHKKCHINGFCFVSSLFIEFRYKTGICEERIM